MNTIRVSKETQEQYKHYLLTDIPDGWKRSKWSRVVRNTKKTYDGMLQGKPFIVYTGEVKVNGRTWIAATNDEGDGALVFWLHAPKSVYERRRK